MQNERKAEEDGCIDGIESDTKIDAGMNKSELGEQSLYKGCSPHILTRTKGE